MQTTPTGRTAPRAYLDVHPWLTDIQNTGEVRFVGTHRVALRYLSVAAPAICIATVDEGHKLAGALIKLQKYLGCEVLSFLREVPNVPWISMGVDHTCPHLHGIPNLWAILHDTLALEGHYGLDAKQRYLQGAIHAKTLIAVSHTSKREFEKTFSAEGRVFHYLPNCHSFSTMLWEQVPQIGRTYLHRTSISLHSVLPYKNLKRTLEIADHFRFQHIHIGRGFYRDAMIAKMKNPVAWLGNADDDTVKEQMQRAGTFICSSFDEGFSLPPLEALIYGVPRLILSD